MPSPSPQPAVMLSQGSQIGERELARRIDSTLLKPTASTADFILLFEEARRYSFWSVCVPPTRVRLAVSALSGSGVKVCTVVGFPLGYSTPAVKRWEARRAIEEGADEIDMVMNVAAFKEADYGLTSEEVTGVSDECKAAGKVLKVIIECCYLTDNEKVRAARMVEAVGADYVKTSTGFGPGGATAEDVALIRRSLKGPTKVKAAGGVSNLPRALAMLEAGAERLGTSSGAAIMEELELLKKGADRRLAGSAVT